MADQAKILCARDAASSEDDMKKILKGIDLFAKKEKNGPSEVGHNKASRSSKKLYSGANILSVSGEIPDGTGSRI